MIKTRNVTFVEIMMSISDTSRPHGCVGTLSKNVSGSGPYVLGSGTLSCTNASDVVVKIKFTANIRNAET